MMLEALSDKEAVDLQSLSKESEDESQFTAKYEAQMWSLGHALCNLQIQEMLLDK